MKKVENKERYLSLFSDYRHSIPIIYSSLEGKYDGELFVDSEIDPQLAVLFTPFTFHYVARNPEKFMEYYLEEFFQEWDGLK
ncbi:hypothetical protein [Alkaliphilus serpentinus]|uniref:Uncharacterized protein n=1 Tax=Alkaliphilus serpentinus TaxID=1482731 RepID=A0A833MAV4_9FIRM|nr:hypothetical protein [Alkaliphilus serpentinus]KAB3531593.1 hypothetical protein F8153_05310 [Alkaliphilus serpentinus]